MARSPDYAVRRCGDQEKVRVLVRYVLCTGHTSHIGMVVVGYTGYSLKSKDDAVGAPEGDFFPLTRRCFVHRWFASSCLMFSSGFLGGTMAPDLLASLSPWRALSRWTSARDSGSTLSSLYRILTTREWYGVWAAPHETVRGSVFSANFNVDALPW